MATCRRCSGTGKLQAGFNDAGQSQYMTCEVCNGTGDSDSPDAPKPQGCVPVIAFLALALGSIVVSFLP